MFGLIRPYYKKMFAQEKCEYRCYYCGLCMGLGRNSGLLSRNLITYDICLAYLVADSISVDTEKKTARCPYSPWRKVEYRDNPELLNKLSAIDYLLAYHKILDDIYDDGSTVARIVEKMMRKKYITISNTHSVADTAIKEGMAQLHIAESKNEKVPVAQAASYFGILLQNTMKGCLPDSLDDDIFCSLCKYLGMWIYIVDACLDLRKDMKKHKYNPLCVGYPDVDVDDIIALRKEEVLTFLIHCKQSMQQLLDLLSCGKNEHLIHNMFEYLLPQSLADLLA